MIANNELGVTAPAPTNRLRRNSIYANPGGAISIDAAASGIPLPPFITEVTLTRVRGTACARCTVEIYSDTGAQGRWYEGTTTADAAGAFFLHDRDNFRGTERHGHGDGWSGQHICVLRTVPHTAASPAPARGPALSCSRSRQCHTETVAKALISHVKRFHLLFLLLVVVQSACGDRAEAQRRRAVASGRTVDPPRPARLGTIPPEATLVAHRDGFIIVMDSAGERETRITFDEPRTFEHVAVSFDRHFIIGNEQLPNPTGEPGGFSRLWIYDLREQTVARLLPGFVTAGNGGVDWDGNGFIYFAAKQQNPLQNPRTPEEFRANAGANDIYRIRYDGSGLQRLLSTPLAGESDVSVSEDGSLVAYVSQPLDDSTPHTEIRVMRSDGSNPRLVYAAGAVGVASAHDPELSPDNTALVFSIVNSSVPPNFPENPAANTAHDIWQIGIDGTRLLRLTRPGPISITPDWKGDSILYLDISETDRYAGISLIRPSVPEQSPQRIKHGVNIGKWIP